MILSPTQLPYYKTFTQCLCRILLLSILNLTIDPPFIIILPLSSLPSCPKINSCKLSSPDDKTTSPEYFCELFSLKGDPVKDQKQA